MSAPGPLPSLAEASRLIAEGRLSPVELADAALARAEALDGLCAFIRLLPERARAAARRAEREIREGRRRSASPGTVPAGRPAQWS